MMPRTASAFKIGLLLKLSPTTTHFLPKKYSFHHDSHFPSFPLEVANIADNIIGKAAGTYKDKQAYQCGLTQQSNTFTEMWDQTQAYSKGFSEMGLKVGDVALVSLANGPLFPKVAYALANIGVTASLLNPMYTPYEIGRILRLTGATVVITQEMLLSNLMQALDEMPNNSIKVLVENYQGNDPRMLPLSSILSGDSSNFQAPKFDYKATTAFMPFSSGTTGNPKGVQLSHYNMTSATDIHKSNMDLTYLTDGNGFLSIIPEFHIFGLMFTSVFTSLGVNLMTLPIFDYDLFLDTLKEKRPGGLSLVPSLATRMALDPNVTKDHLSSLQMVACGGAILPPAISKAFREKSPPKMEFWVAYGMTECPTIAKCSNPDHTIREKLNANVAMKVVDTETGETLVKQGEQGEICIKAPHVMQGYYKNPTATAETLIDGWLHTGDVGYMDEQGHLNIVDRKKDLIKYKGFQVSPTEVEEVILMVPGVQSVSVIGVPDDCNGEVPKAFVVVAEEGHKATESEIHAMVNKSLSSYKRLRGGIEFVGALPTSPSGKVLRKELRKMSEAAATTEELPEEKAANQN